MFTFPFLRREPTLAKLDNSPSAQDAVKRASCQMLRLESEYDVATFSLNSFQSWVEKKRQRETHIIGWKMPIHLYGAWFAAGCHDFIFFDVNTPRLHQAHIQLHEISHILLGHETLDVSTETGLPYRELMDYFAMLLRKNACQNESLVNPVLKRSALDRTTQDEMEAEALSNLIQQRVQALQARNEWQTPLSFSHNPFILEAYHSMDWV